MAGVSPDYTGPFPIPGQRRLCCGKGTKGAYKMLITKDMGIMEIVQKYPATVEVLQRFGMGCIGWAAAHF